MSTETQDYITTVEAWRQRIEEPLRRDWLSLIGRFDLADGTYRVGSHPEAEIHLPAGSAPAEVGVITVVEREVRFEPNPGTAVTLNGEPLSSATALRSDADPEQEPDVISIGNVSWTVIERNGRLLLRARDANSPAIAAFAGRRWYPVDEAYRIEGRFVAYDQPRTIPIANILGDSSDELCPGAVIFTLGGAEHRLDATEGPGGSLMLHFRDATNGTTTYSGGRSLLVPAPEGEIAIVDFNRAANLPCAFTPFATCPVPLPQNRLSIAIQAGEQLPNQG
jgi:uncharacterized protein